MSTRSEQADRADPVVAAVRKSDAASLKVYLGDGTEKAVAISKARNRWSKLLEVLDSMPWERIECLDTKGAVLATLDNEEDLDDEYDDESASKTEVAKQAKVMFSLMKHTLGEARKMFEVQMKANTELVTAMTEGLHQLQQAHRLAMQVNIANIAKSEDDSEMGQVMKFLAMQLMQNSLPKQIANSNPQPPKGK